MYGFRVHAWETDPVWEEIPDPVPESNEVLVEVEACSVGLTVLNCMNGNLSDDPALLPRVPGHELIGRVIDAGSDVDRSMIGKRVAAYFYLVCGSCSACQAGRDPQCANLAGWIGVNQDGGYAPLTAIPQHNAIVMPDGLDPVLATVVPDAVATPVHIARRAAIGPDDRVVVFGAGGGLGAHMIQVASHNGASVAGFDITDEKMALIDRLGATAVRSDDLGSINPATVFTDGPPTVVIDFLGRPESARWALDGLDMGGRLVSLTTFPGRDYPVQAREFVFRELSLLGSRYAWRSELVEAANLVLSGAVEPVIGEVVVPDGLLGLHEQLRAGSLLGRGALDWRK